ncbi:sigma-70 family RNA polymerase sigma factor [Paenibacillus mendelii]|uniref:Sigma-70 family RNA polymerase sigma factor n=1 Tax=Paenibacillus mendelii TaxID=206163 RepID=A0ABV6JLH3_9BACL|nr:sigma-70 family RNA polymerase sigma factor [Paenibacillus mendelii]MCQ6562212.1 RNA polymerase sigma factor [Paenibacillus mendelii]
MNKKQLAEAAARGDEQAFLQLMNNEKQQMLRIAYAYMRNEADALEAIQETVCRAWLKRNSLKKPGYISTWLIRILIHVCTDELRRRKRTIPADTRQESLQGGMESDHHSLDETDAAENRLDIAYAVEQLEGPYKDVIRLKYYEDMTIVDIADILQRPDGTIRTWLHKALKQLRKYMADRGGAKER